MTVLPALPALSAGYAADSIHSLYLTGSSSMRYSIAASIKKLCTNASGMLTVYKNGPDASSLANQMVYVCTQPMAGTGILTVYHTTTGGSLNSILGMSNDVAKQQVPVSKDCIGLTGTVAGTGALTGYTVRPNCSLETSAVPSDGGFSGVEYGPVSEQVTGLTTGVDGFGLFDVTQDFTGVAQAFGIAVSEKMYKDLQTAQGLTAGGCIAGDPLPACQPSLSRADIVSLINNNVFSAQKNGAEALGLTAGASIQYARGVTTSGTQSGAQVYFLGKGCLTGENFGQLMVIGDEIASGTTQSYNRGLFTVSANSGTSDVITKLTAAGNTSYAFGVVSMENRSPVGTTGWRFVKMNGVAISDGTATGLNKQNALDGRYDYFFEVVTYKGPTTTTDTDEGTLIDAIAAKMATVTADGGSVTLGMFIGPENMGGYTHAAYPSEVSFYERGGSTPNSCAPVNRPN